MDDLIFLIQSHRITSEELEPMLNEALPQAGKFDFHPEIRQHLEELKKRLR